MDLAKQKWTKQDILEFNKYLEELIRKDKMDFTKRTVNTNMELLAIPIPDIRKITSQIAKGNFIDYLDKFNNKYYENTLINAILINKIKDIETKKYYLSKLVVDNWSTVDILKFNIKGKEKEYLKLAKEYIKNENQFIRRIGVRILFSYTKNDDLTEVFKIVDSLYNEEEYYVNMCVAWLMCEIVINNRDKAFEYFNSRNNKLNKFTMNKTISKCRDSFRVSKEDKELLKKYRVL